jgi:hypothetical protein
MAWHLWSALVLCLMVLAAIGISAPGSRRWSEATLALTQSLDNAAIDNEADPSRPTRYNARELDGLPAPVQRYFRLVLKDGQPTTPSAQRQGARLKARR